MKDATLHFDAYFAALDRLSYPSNRMSLGFFESDSTDETFTELQRRTSEVAGRYRRVGVWKKDFGFHIPPRFHRWDEPWQIPRRAVLARSRNHLLARALDDEEWVLWLDVDVVDYPADVIETMLRTGKDIVHPYCVRGDNGATFDHNAWRDGGRVMMHDLKDRDLVRLDAVGGTMLLVRADLHREGLIFPPFLYGRRSPFVRDPNPWIDDVGEIETEGFGLMAKDMGYECWGMPNLVIRHGPVDLGS